VLLQYELSESTAGTQPQTSGTPPQAEASLGSQRVADGGIQEGVAVVVVVGVSVVVVVGVSVVVVVGVSVVVVVGVSVVVVVGVSVVVVVGVSVVVVVLVVGAAVVVGVVVSHGPRRSPWPRWPSTALWGTSMVFSAGVPGLWQMVSFCCRASAREGISAARAVPAKSLSALRRLIEPSASALARSSKDRLVDSWLTCCPLFPKGGTRGSPAQLYNEDKYERLQTLTQLPRIPKRRSSQNFYSTHSGE
jgi:hypothetical protein